MATFYLDFENGNDANAGTSWALAWKTINNGATAARIAPGDEIRVAKTADPTSIGNATWTNKSATVTLASAQTATLYLDGSWTLANSATVTTTTTRKQGSNASQITTPASTATATKYAYYATGTLDLSSYDAITFWFRNNTSAVADANRYVLKLCSDTTGDTAVDEFAIPAIASTTRWVPFTLTRTGGGALGSSIKSIALYTGSSSPGNSQQIFIDDVLACDIDGLNLTSLISKNSAGYGGTNSWHGLQSISGTTVIIGNTNVLDAGSASLRGYYTTGTSPETVTTYVRPTFKFAMQSGFTTSSQPLQDSGTAGNLISYTGGWNTSSNTQDGETWIDGQNGLGIGIYGGNLNYWSISRINCCRFNAGVFNNNVNSNGCQVTDYIGSNCSNSLQGDFTNSTITYTGYNNGQTFSEQGGNNIYDIKSYNSSTSEQPGANSRNRYNNFLSYNCGGNFQVSRFGDYQNVEYTDGAGSLEIVSNCNSTIDNLTIKNLTTAISGGSGNGKLIVNKLTASGNTNMGTVTGEFIVKQTNAASTQLIGSTSSTSVQAYYPSVMFNSVNNVATDNRSFWQYGNALSQTTVRHTASGVAWQINITNTLQALNTPIYFPIARVACNANSLVTIKAWVKLSHATDIGAKLLIQKDEIAGVTADVTATKAADTNWEELTITFTPTSAGVAQIYLQGYWLANTADESIYVDDITITQA